MSVNSAFSWQDYLQDGYFDENGKPRKELYMDWAQAIAKELSQKGMTRASIRRFYGLIKGLEPFFKDERTYEEERHRLYPVVPLANYVVNKEDQKLPVQFKIFMERNTEEALKSYKHFLAFIGHFQSVIAYFTGN